MLPEVDGLHDALVTAGATTQALYQEINDVSGAFGYANTDLVSSFFDVSQGPD